MRYGFGTRENHLFRRPSNSLPGDAQRLLATRSRANSISCCKTTQGVRALRNAARHDPSGNCCFTNTPPVSLLSFRLDARDVPPLPDDWQGPAPCVMQLARLGLDRSGLHAHTSSLMWGGSRCRAPNFGWWANNDRKRYAAPQTEAEDGKNREAACWCSPRCYVAKERCLLHLHTRRVHVHYQLEARRASLR
ncbi:hypothetical protein BU25DRAFT_12630 [Macroventuria anomochaeta]|uniref:Uncharacterized protein n=1 Tax=Macroventuria anomochaeta TaxID=301207 RepID=A0ACB6SJT4_9PLEO|nr:uncharacterized protein BU25DRAFT_12630 [Macroventuria anomochaeta]KAF2633764.1 hypothetical protein BU25DRAFT_12630 [Macroventuria anomochaeta]